MIQAYKNFWKQAFNYKGVSTRKEYWLVALVNALIGLVLGILIGIAVGMNEVNISLGIAVLSLFYCLAVLVPSLPLGVRRLRDAGFLKSASIRSVFFPLFAKTIARFAETVDFPSSGPAEVTTIVFIS